MKIKSLYIISIVIMVTVLIVPTAVSAGSSLDIYDTVLFAGGEAEECPDTICSLQFVDFGRASKVPLGTGPKYIDFDFSTSGAAYFPSTSFNSIRKVIAGVTSSVATSNNNGIESPTDVEVVGDSLYYLTSDQRLFKIGIEPGEFEQATQIHSSEPISFIMSDTSDNLYLKTEAHEAGKIIRLSPSGTESLIYEFSPSNYIANFRDWTIDPAGNIYITTTGGSPEPDKGNGNKILKLTPDGQLTDLVAGGFGQSGEGTAPEETKLMDPMLVEYYDNQSALVWIEGNPETDGSRKIRYLQDGKVYTLKSFTDFTRIAGMRIYNDFLFIINYYPSSALKGFEIFRNDLSKPSTTRHDNDPFLVVDTQTSTDQTTNTTPTPTDTTDSTDDTVSSADAVTALKLFFDDGKEVFHDVHPDHPFYNSTRWAKEAGIVRGYNDGTVGVDRPVTRGELIEILYRLYRKKIFLTEPQL